MKKVLLSAVVLAAITIGTFSAKGEHHSSMINKGYYQDTTKRDTTKKHKIRRDTTNTPRDTTKKDSVKN